MPRRTEPVPERECQAADCAKRFVPKRDDARYCSPTCRQRAGRARKAAEAAARPGPIDPDTGNAEHGLVTAVRKELEAASAYETVAGQLALQLARRIANPDEGGLSQLSRELRSLLAEAKAAGTAMGEPASAPAVEEDEVTRAREARERKAREAAAR